MDTRKNVIWQSLYIGVDLGTTHIKTAVFDEHGTLLELQKQKTPMIKDELGPIYSPKQFYELVSDQLIFFLKKYNNIKGISITGMSEAGLIINRRGGFEETSIIPWFDQRTEQMARKVDIESEINHFYITGLRNSYKYGIYKYLWLLEHYDLKKEDTIWLSVADYIVWKLTGKYVTDSSFAARTYVYDIIHKCWDKKRLEEYGLTEANFPEVYPSGASAGYLTDKNLIMTNHNELINICIGGHDHVCAAYVVIHDDANRICNSVGTAETYLGIEKELSITKDHYDSGLVYGPFLNGKEYFWMANISSSGQSVEWFCNKMQIEKIDYTDMNEMISELQEVPTNILYYPFLSGIGTPVYRTDIGGGFLGLRPEHTRSHLMKSILEGINYQGKWLLSLVPGVENSNAKKVICVGGASNSPCWMQLKANILGLPVFVPGVTEATLLGSVAIMLEKNYGSDARQSFIQSIKNNTIYQVDSISEEKYHEIYKNKYIAIIDAILK